MRLNLVEDSLAAFGDDRVQVGGGVKENHADNDSRLLRQTAAVMTMIRRIRDPHITAVRRGSDIQRELSPSAAIPHQFGCAFLFRAAS